MDEETQITCPRSGSDIPVLNHSWWCFKELWDYHLLGSELSLRMCEVFSPEYQVRSSKHLAQVWHHPTDHPSWGMTRCKPIYLSCCPTHIWPSWVKNVKHFVKCFPEADMSYLRQCWYSCPVTIKNNNNNKVNWRWVMLDIDHHRTF